MNISSTFDVNKHFEYISDSDNPIIENPVYAKRINDLYERNNNDYGYAIPKCKEGQFCTFSFNMIFDEKPKPLTQLLLFRIMSMMINL